jgi:hypothetical protein
MRGSRDHRRLVYTAIQRSNTGEHKAIEAGSCQRLFSKQDHLFARRAALAAKANNERHMTCLIADIHMHHKNAPPEPHDHDAPGPSTAKGFEAVWTAPDEAP